MVITHRPLDVETSNTFILARLVAWGGALAFIVSAAWYGLVVEGITVASAPKLPSNQPVREQERTYFDWLVPTLHQERLYTSLAIGGFCCLVGAVMLMPRRPGVRSGSAVAAAAAVGAGSGLWVVGNIVQLGGHRAVGLLVTHGAPLRTVNSLDFTVDTVDDTFELAAFALLGAGMLLLGWSAIRGPSAARTWGRYTCVLGLVLLATSVSYAVDNGDLTNVLMLAAGVVLMPIWLVWSARPVDRAQSAHGGGWASRRSDAASLVSP
jgi:hypothetical protein